LNLEHHHSRAAIPHRHSAFGWIAGLLLFAAAASIVVWQNSRLAVLWDLSYVLENAHRMALGQVPYRDFPFPYPPLTFVIQAALMKFAGRVFWHTTVYCATLNGLSIVLTWRILIKALRDRGVRAQTLPLLLALPLIPLGIYSVFPHPFYDPDCTFAILVSLYLLQRSNEVIERAVRPSRSRLWPLLAGISLVIPLFVKQNTGLAFIASVAIAFLLLLVLTRARRSLRQLLLIVQGVAVALFLALFLINWTAGIKNYWHWTIQFAASRRTPARAEMLEIYSDKGLILWLALVIAGGILLWFAQRSGKRLLRITSALLLAAPFVWPVIYLLRDNDASERAERLLNVWPVLLILSFVVSVLTMRRRRGLAVILPFIIIGAVHGAFMSQQLWGSTYAIWPLFMILLTITVADLSTLWGNPAVDVEAAKPNEGFWYFSLPLTAVIVLSLLVAGAFYLKSHERLDYANLDEGELKRSTLPQLKGMATKGDWIPNFEELVRYTDAHIPRDEGILLLPGEDLFYFTTGRAPKFPVLMFDHTVNPYSPEEIIKLARERDIRWLIVKQDLQDEDEGVEKQRDELTEALEQDFEQVESLSSYDIYQRRDPNKKDEDDDDNDRDAK
jgi:hypothetical protein